MPPKTTETVFGWYLTIGFSPSYTLFIDPKNSVKTIYERRGKTPLERRVTIDGVLYINTVVADPAEQRIIDRSLKPFLKENQSGIDVRIQFDGEIFEILEHPASHENNVIFRGSGSF
jgi:hypothetical protein